MLWVNSSEFLKVMAEVQTTLQYDVFISYARADGRDLAERLYLSLKERGAHPWRDERNLNPYQDFSVGIERAIRASRYVIVLLTPEVACRADSFVRREILEAQAHQKPIIPLITSGFDPANVPIHIKHLTWLPFADFEVHLPAVLDRLAESPGDFVPAQPPDDPFREYVEDLRDFVTRELEFSLLNLLSLRILDTPNAISAPPPPPLPVAFKSRVLHHNRKASTPSLERDFEDFNAGFAAHDGRILLLGEPGAGKTTALLSFAREKAIARLANPAALLPVYAPLSTWDGDSELTEWLATATGGRLDAESLCQEIGEKRVLLILDGLDEMAIRRRNFDQPHSQPRDLRIEFLTALKSNATSALVSCRVKNYDDIVATGGEKITLNGALTLQPLSDELIRSYLKDQPELWHALQFDAALLDMARTPLLLTLLAVGYRDCTPEERLQLRNLSSSSGELRDRIFTNYIAKRYKHEEIRSAESLPYTLEELIEKLGRAIVQMLRDQCRYDFSLLAEEDFHEADRVALTGLAIRLHLLQPAGKGKVSTEFDDEQLRWRFFHLLLRDYLGFRSAITYLGHVDENERNGAALALAKIGEPRAVQAILGALNDPKNTQSPYMAFVIREVNDSRALEPLIDGLANPNRVVRECAVNTLGQLRDARAVEPLITALTDPQSSVRAEAATALEEIGDARAVVPLITALADPDGWVRHKVAGALGQLGDARAVEPLIAGLTNSDEGDRRYSASALGRLGDIRGVEPLITALADPDSSVRANAATALGQIGDARAVAPLKKLLSDDALGTRLKSPTGITKRVYHYAVEALERIGTPDALIAIEKSRLG